jgi:hypothetical protein
MVMTDGSKGASAGGEARQELPRAPELAGLGHDLRSLLAAATTNLEFVRVSEGLEGEPADILAEVDRELRLAADVLELVTSSRPLERVSAVDLRAAFWLARRVGGRVVVDAASEPFPVRANVAALLDWVSELATSCPPRIGAQLVREAEELRIGPVDRAATMAFIDDARAEELGLVVELVDDVLVLRASM